MVEFVRFLLERFRFQILFFVTAIAVEVFVRTDLAKRLLSRSFALDLFYAAFYRLGIFSLLLIDPVRAYLDAHLAVPLFDSVPPWLRAVLYLLFTDFTNYWIHRLGHSSSFFWAFHQVHHSVDQLTMMALYRTHPIDSWLRTVIAPTLFMLVLGLPPAIWLPLSIVWDINLNLSHLEVDWTYGRFGRIFVSPVFHSVHHGVDGKSHHVNFGMGLSIWDTIFRYRRPRVSASRGGGTSRLDGAGIVPAARVGTVPRSRPALSWIAPARARTAHYGADVDRSRRAARRGAMSRVPALTTRGFQGYYAAFSASDPFVQFP